MPTARMTSMPPSTTLPPRMARLGFLSLSSDGVDFIVPPLCRVRAGQFLMGSDPLHDLYRQKDEQPQTKIGIGAFHIGRFPVTVAEYACFVRAGHEPPHRTFPANVLSEWSTQLERPDHPVVGVTWY